MGEGRPSGNRRNTDKMGKPGVREGRIHSSSCQSEEEWEALHARLRGLGQQQETGRSLDRGARSGTVGPWSESPVPGEGTGHLVQRSTLVGSRPLAFWPSASTLYL